MGKRDRQLIEAACRIVGRVDEDGRVVMGDNATFRDLHRKTEAGSRVEHGRVVFEEVDARLLRRWLSEQGVDPAVGIPEAARSRTEIARYRRNEKAGAAGIGSHYGLAAVAPIGGVSINGQALQLGAGVFACVMEPDVQSVSASWALTIENEDVFLQLAKRGFEEPPADNGLVILRTMPGLPAGMTLARRLRSQGLSHYHSPDIDPAGLEICLQQPLDGLWLPTIETLDAVRDDGKASPDNYRRQTRDRPASGPPFSAAEIIRHFPALERWVTWVKENRVGVTEESAWANGGPFTWLHAHP